MTPDIHTLTGAHAVNALPDDERRMFERHLADCEACRREVAELRSTAARLGAASSEQPPDAMRERVLATIDTVRQVPRSVPERPASVAPSAPPQPRRTRDSWGTWLGSAAAAILIVAAVFLGGLSADLDRRVDELQAANQRIVDVLGAPDATTLAMDGPSSATASVVMSPTRGEALFVASGLPEVPEEQIYELWLISGETATPAGLVRPDDGRAQHVMSGDLTTVTAIGVTVEPAAGSPQPTSDPILVAPVVES